MKRRTAMLKKIVGVMITAAVIVTVQTECLAGLSANGLSANGLSANGLSANGLSANGLSANGLSANGKVTLDGVRPATPVSVEAPQNGGVVPEASEHRGH